MKKEIIEIFGGVLRVRVCGLLVDDNGLLLVRHQGLNASGIFWSPPGGGMEFGQSAQECLKREFLEETGLEISVSDLLFIHELNRPPLHAVELFFEVKRTGGKLATGYDPELEAHEQIINEVRYFKSVDFQKVKAGQLHAVLSNIRAPEQVLNLKGYFHYSK
jgi:8-oxo-dGTP diphosphatase